MSHRPGVHESTPSATGLATTSAAIGALLLWAALWAWRSWSVSGLSWHFFADGGLALLDGSGLHVYADQPTLQVGPLALLVAGGLDLLLSVPAKEVALGLMTLVGPTIVIILAPLVRGGRALLRVVAGAAVFIPAWTVLAVRWGHLDDVLAMLAAVVAVRAVWANRPAAAGLALAAALAAKPWAVGFLPILLGLSSGAARAAMIGLVGGMAAWLPFFIAAPGTAEALRPQVPLIAGSGLHTLGVRGGFVPAWGRTTQLLAAPAVGLITALRGQWPGVLLVAVAVRLALDPQDNAYYVGSAAAAALVFDLVGTRWTVPWTTLLTVMALWQPFVEHYDERLATTGGLSHWWFAHPAEVGWIHLGWAAFTVALVLSTPRLAEPAPRRSDFGAGPPPG